MRRVNSWTRGEDEAIKRLWPSGDWDAVRRALPGRTFSAIKLRAYKLGVKVREKLYKWDAVPDPSPDEIRERAALVRKGEL